MKYLVLIFLTLALILSSALTQEDNPSETTEGNTKLKLSVDFGEDIDSNTAIVTKLLVAVGDSVDGGQLLLELSTDESIQEVTSPLPAIIAEIHISEGDEVLADQELVTIELEAAQVITDAVTEEVVELEVTEEAEEVAEETTEEVI